MTQKKDNAKTTDWKEVFGSGQDGLRALVQEMVQEVLEAEMDEAVGAQKSDARIESVIQPGTIRGRWSPAWESWCCGFPRTGKEDSGRKCSSGIHGAKRRW